MNIKLFLGVLTLSMLFNTTYAQDRKDSVIVSKKSWEFSLGINLMKQSQLSHYEYDDSNKNLWVENRDPQSYMQGLEFGVNRELNNAFSLGFFAKTFYSNKKTLDYYLQGGLNLSMRFSKYLSDNKYFDPFIRVGASIAYNKWDGFYKANSKIRTIICPINTGLGFNSYLNDHIGVSVSFDYLTMPYGDVANTYSFGTSLIWRIGGETKIKECPELSIEDLLSKNNNLYLSLKLDELTSKIRFEKGSNIFAVSNEESNASNSDKNLGISIKHNKNLELDKNISDYLDELAKLLKSEKGNKYLIKGYIDSPTDDISLANDRANIIRDELIIRGVDPSSLVAKGINKVHEKGKQIEIEKAEFVDVYIDGSSQVDNLLSSSYYEFDRIHNIIYFDFDSKTINKQIYSESIDLMVSYLENNPKDKFLITGFADKMGDPGYNKNLSKDRAMSLKNELISRGITSDRIEIKAVGESIASKSVICNNKERAIDRKIFIEIIKR